MSLTARPDDSERHSLDLRSRDEEAKRDRDARDMDELIRLGIAEKKRPAAA